MRIYKIAQAPKAQYMGNCVDSFDNEGNCTNGLFQDTSDFAAREEIVRDEDTYDVHYDSLISSDDFKELVHFPDFLQNRDMEYYRYDNGVYIAYDLDSNIHYFFA